MTSRNPIPSRWSSLSFLCLLAGFAFALALLASSTAMNVARVSSPLVPHVYAGTRIDLAALRNDRPSLARYESLGIALPAHPALDLPLSVVGDTLLLPFALTYDLSEPLVGAVERQPLRTTALG